MREQFLFFLDKIDQRYDFGSVKIKLLPEKIIYFFSLNPKAIYPLLLIINYFYFDNEYLLNIILAFLFDILIFFSKRLIGRKRPIASSKISLIQRASGLAPDGYSFPSAHSFTVFQIIPFFLEWFVAWGILILFYSLAVMFSRLILKHHHFTDVIVGAILGLVWGIVNLVIF